VKGQGFKVKELEGRGCRLMVNGFGLGIKGSMFRAQRLSVTAEGRGCRVEGLL